MILEWVQKHKRLSVIFVVSAFVVLGIILVLVLRPANTPSEEQEAPDTVTMSNVNVLYNYFSDYTIQFVLNAIHAALNNNQTMVNGNTTDQASLVPNDATDEALYPDMSSSGYTVSVKDNKVETSDNSWGTWEVFTINVSDGRTFVVRVGVTPKSRDDPISYTQISVIKQ